MTHEEKADELIRKYYKWGLHKDGQSLSWLEAKECALIAVDEIINNNTKIPGLLTQDTMHNTWYWQEVKQEIENL